MTAAKLFLQRFLQNFRFQVKSWRLGIDWTVFVYLLIPAVIVAVAVYRSWWVETPIWMDDLSFTSFLFMFYVLAWMGSIRLFIEEADQLFLLQKRSVYLTLRSFGIGYSLVKSTVAVAFILAVFLPYLVKQQHAIHELIRMFILLSLWKAVFLLIKQSLFFFVSRRFIRFLLLTSIFLLCNRVFILSVDDLKSTVSFIIVLVLVAFVIFLSRLKICVIGHFHEELEREIDSKYFVASLMLLQSGAIERRKIKQRRKPWIFRKSNQWFKQRSFHHVAIEHYIKAWLRKPQHIFSYVRFLGFSIVALILFPGGWNMIVLIMILLLFYQMVKGEWEQFERSPFIEIVARDRADLKSVKKQILLIFTAPAYFIFLIVHGVVSSKWLFALVMLCFVFYLTFKTWLKPNRA
ncbi:ABC transporter permease [Pueribacillus sp. YX66]|uniref:ABC transporter permease n=1 Tax=Pueribacillus sp. YX66 TaxID=3229242 RepID=UPI00358CDF26